MEQGFFSGNKRKYILAGTLILAVYFFLKYISPVVSPFILAFLAVGVVNKITDRLPVRIWKSFLAGLLLLLLTGGFLLFVWGIGCFLFDKGGEMAGELSCYREDFHTFLGSCCDGMESRFGVDGEAIESFVIQQLTVFAENIEVKVLPAMMDRSLVYFKSAAGILGFLAVTVIAMFLIMKDYGKICSAVLKREELRGAVEIGRKVLDYCKTFLRAQIILLMMISALCSAVLGLLGMRGGLMYGILTGFMDMLPFIGTGIMLLPLAAFELLKGSWQNAFFILCLYGGCVLLRELLEPKLIGNKVGIWPVGILLAVFAGIRLFGVFGIIKGPVGLVIICEACKYLFREKENCVS